MSIPRARDNFNKYADELLGLKELDINEMFRYLIACGSKLPSISNEERNPLTYVAGCVSNAYLVVEEKDNCINIRGDAEAMVVKGFMAIISDSCSFLSINDFVAEGRALIQQFLDRVDFKLLLTPTRANSFGNLVEMTLFKALELSKTN